MAVEQKKELVMYFERTDGKEFRMTIPHYREGITDEEVKTGAAGIVTDNIFKPEGFPLIKLSGGKRVDTTTTDVAVE